MQGNLFIISPLDTVYLNELEFDAGKCTTTAVIEHVHSRFPIAHLVVACKRVILLQTRFGIFYYYFLHGRMHVYCSFIYRTAVVSCLDYLFNPLAGIMLDWIKNTSTAVELASEHLGICCEINLNLKCKIDTVWSMLITIPAPLCCDLFNNLPCKLSCMRRWHAWLSCQLRNEIEGIAFFDRSAAD